MESARLEFVLADAGGGAEAGVAARASGDVACCVWPGCIAPWFIPGMSAMPLGCAGGAGLLADAAGVAGSAAAAGMPWRVCALSWATAFAGQSEGINAMQNIAASASGCCARGRLGL